MTSQLVEGIAKWKGHKSKIYTESFGADTDYVLPNDKSKVIQVHFQRSNLTVQWDHEFKNILEFAESKEIILDAGCMFGKCGACSTKLYRV